MRTKLLFQGVLSVFCAVLQLHAGPVDVAPGRILVKSRYRQDVKNVDDACRPFSGRRVNEIAGLGVHVIEVPSKAWLPAIMELCRNPDIEFVEPDFLREPDAIPNDPYYSSQWHLPKIQANLAWDGAMGSPSVVIAILDTGVDPTHPDLASKLVPGWNFYDNNSNTTDVYGHGTAVAGTAAAASNNGAGVAGVAGACKIMPIRVSDPNGMAYDSTIATALNWAADHGARVANISFGAADSATVQTAARYFQAKGGVVTVSAGNSGLFNSNPDNAYLLNVSATDGNDLLATFSNTGNNIDLAAPGVNIFTTTRGGGYGSCSGTSFSAPIVAGVAALVFSANPALTGADASNLIRQNADDLGPAGFDTSFGYGRVNAYRAVSKALALAGLSIPPASNTNTTTPPSSTPAKEAVLSRSGGTLRNNYSGNVGFKFVAATNAAVTQLGRWVVAGNTGSHTLQLLNSALLPLGSTVVNTAGATPGQILYASLASPVTLLSGQTYYLMCNETYGGDSWYDDYTQTITENTAIISGMRAAYSAGVLNLGKSYVPLSFKYAAPQEAIIATSGGTLRTNYAGPVGFKFVAAANATVTHLGRWTVPGNTGVHTLQILNSALAVLASGLVNTAGAPSGQFTYVQLTSPLTLQKGQSYFVFTTEVYGGDQWYDCNQSVTENPSLISQLQSAYGAGKTNIGKGYGPLNFRFILQ